MRTRQQLRLSHSVPALRSTGSAPRQERCDRLESACDCKEKKAGAADAPGAPSYRDVVSKGAQAGGDARLRAENSRLQAELAKLKTQGAAAAGDTQTSGEEAASAGGADIELLVLARSRHVRDFGEDDQIVRELDERIRKARSLEWAAKGPEKQVRALEANLRKARQKHDKQAAAVERIRKELGEAILEEAKGLAEMEATDKELAAARDKLPVVSPPGTMQWVDQVLGAVPEAVQKGQASVLAHVRILLSGLGEPDADGNTAGGGDVNMDASGGQPQQRAASSGGHPGATTGLSAELLSEFVAAFGGPDAAKRLRIAEENGEAAALIKRLRGAATHPASAAPANANPPEPAP